MYKILEARNLAGPNYEMIVEAPRVAARCLPGQFIIVKLDETAERIPLTITDYDREKGTVEIINGSLFLRIEKISAINFLCPFT